MMFKGDNSMDDFIYLERLKRQGMNAKHAGMPIGFTVNPEGWNLEHQKKLRRLDADHTQLLRNKR